jgi:hypothetical protein
MIIINFSRGSQTYSNHMESQCLINTTNFIEKIKIISINFLEYFQFLVRMMYIFLPQIYFGFAQYKLEKKNSFVIEFFVL